MNQLSKKFQSNSSRWNNFPKNFKVIRRDEPTFQKKFKVICRDEPPFQK